jgi:C-terminal processing protease CtpA/Prc
MNSEDEYDLSPWNQDGGYGRTIETAGGNDQTLCDPHGNEEEEEDEDDNDVMFSDEATCGQHFDLDSQQLQITEQELYFKVHAPPGKLGLVIETTNGVPPTVISIHPTSALVDEDIQIGDVLTTVDGCPVSGMRASEVSQLIGSKINKPTRVLVFAHR